jgi:hypothetical protein
MLFGYFIEYASDLASTLSRCADILASESMVY